MKPSMELNDELWQAIIRNDESYNGKFYYGVETTGIFCRPSCASRQPSRKHVRVFYTARDAIQAGFRPCKRCEPAEQLSPDESWVESAAFWLETHYAESLTLELLSEAMHRSPYYLQRTFKRVKGVSPADYLLQIRLQRAKRFLAETERSVADIGMAVGVQNAAYFATLFHKHTGLTPTEYRKQMQQAAQEEESS